jgi:hypothetical protein
MKRFIATSLTSILLAASSAVMAQGVPVVLPDHDFGTVSGFGKHMFFNAGELQTFAFTVPAGMVNAEIVFSDDPNTRDQSTRATLSTWTSGIVPKVQVVNYSRVRTTTIPVVAGKRYFFTINTSTTIAFAVMVRYRKPVVVTPPRRR